MMKFVAKEDEPTCVAELSGCFGVYLDNDSLIELARGAALRRQRFVDALLRGGDLLFSLTNAIEIAWQSHTTGGNPEFPRQREIALDSLGAEPLESCQKGGHWHFRPSRGFRIVHEGVL